MLNLTSAIIAYEQGELDQDETAALFQSLVDSGLAWTVRYVKARNAAEALRKAGV